MNRFITYLLCLVVAASAVAQIDVNGLVTKTGILGAQDKPLAQPAGKLFPL